MAQKEITREEFDQRLAQSTERTRHDRIALEARAAELEDLIGRYASALERIEAESEAGAFSEGRSELRNLLNELAKRTSEVAAAL